MENMTKFNKIEFFGEQLNQLFKITEEEIKNKYSLREYKKLRRYNKRTNLNNIDLIILPMNFNKQELINFISNLVFQGYYTKIDNGGLGNFYLPTQKYYGLLIK